MLRHSLKPPTRQSRPSIETSISKAEAAPKGQKESIYPADVYRALKYFSDNGFSLSESMTKESVATAKKQLARVFHPDRDRRVMFQKLMLIAFIIFFFTKANAATFMLSAKLRDRFF